MEKQIVVTETELYMLAAEMVMENMPMTNKEFNPKDKDECVEKLMDLVERKMLSHDWLASVASANASNCHVYVDCDEKWVGSYLGGLSRAQHSRDEFIARVKDAQENMRKGNVIVKGKGPKRQFGKNYFNKMKNR